MRKLLFLLIILAATTCPAGAQTKAPGRKQLNWGLSTGVNFSTLDSKDAQVQTHWRTGFVAGAYFRARICSDFSIQPELLFSSMGADLTNVISGDQTLRLNYFTLPLLARYQFARHWAAIAGPQFDFLVGARRTTRQDSEKIDGDFRDHTYTATAGIEFWPVAGLGLTARYMHGLQNVQTTGPSVKSQGVQLTLSVKL